MRKEEEIRGGRSKCEKGGGNCKRREEEIGGGRRRGEEGEGGNIKEGVGNVMR